VKSFLPLCLLFILYSCSSIKAISDGKKYEVDCHKMTSSDVSCAQKIKDKCPKGLVIEKSVSKYKLLKGPYRSVTVICN
jgi:hypothetical protein